MPDDAFDFDPNETPDDEAWDRNALVSSIRRADDFALLFVVTEPARARPRLMAEIAQRLGDVSIQTVVVPPGTRNLLHLLQDELETPRPGALFVTGLENVVSGAAPPKSQPIILNLNAARNNFYPLIPRPMVLWVAPFVMQAIRTGAPDFTSIRSGVYFFATTDDEHADMLAIVQNVAPMEILGMDRAARNASIADMEALLRAYDALPSTQQYPLDKARVLSSLGVAYLALGDYAAAEAVLNYALEMRRAALPPGHPDIATSLNNLAGLYYSTGRYDEALPLFEEAAEMLAAALGEAHPNTKTVRRNVGRFREEQERRKGLLDFQKVKPTRRT